MRQNGGGSGFLADQMAAYFFDEPLEISNSGQYDQERGEFFFDPRGVSRFYLPPEDLRFSGPVAVLVGPNCNSACEFFTYAMTVQERAAIVGQYPTAGLGGGQEAFVMPGGVVLQFSAVRPVDMEGSVIIEGTGIEPTVRVPVDEETLFSDSDPILDAAEQHILGQQ
jgi:C-terminal processing protease CtpA/Prc